MHLIITDAWLARRHAIHLSGTRLVLWGMVAALTLMLLAAGMYHWVFLKGAREGWPVIGSLVRLVVRDDTLQRERVLRENLDMMAKRLGEMQARLVQMEALGERLSGLTGVNPQELKQPPGQGGALVASRNLTLEELQGALEELDTLTSHRTDVLTLMESRLFEQRMRDIRVPTQKPVSEGHVGSPFGFRIDPFTGRSALHTGLDFQAPVGTPILAAAGGVVVAAEYHPAYGYMVEVDHGDALVTRYAHASKLHVQKGDLVKRGQLIADVGSTGRSTGPHLHFEVWVQGVPQDPQKFLTAGDSRPDTRVAAAPPAPSGVRPDPTGPPR